jgi:formiminotetrahydrofolate cyclodeaminase
LEQYLAALADRTPAPGGGAVAAATLATAAAIAHMAVVFSQGRKSLNAHATLHEQALATLAAMQPRGLAMADDDAAAFATLNGLWQLPEDDPIRQAGWDAAVEAAIAAPMQVIQQAHQLLELLSQLPEATSPMLQSDLAVAAITAEAAARSACWNVRINLSSISDPEQATAHRRAAESTVAACQSLAERVEAACQSN